METTAVTKALFVRLEAKPGQEAALESFLVGARAAVMAETGTIAWFAVRFGASTFAIFDVFPDDDARAAHLAGVVGQALGEHGPALLAGGPSIEHADVLASKLP